jgi:hypothetical protein
MITDTIMTSIHTITDMGNGELTVAGEDEGAQSVSSSL